ncbi:FCD domain-containing protein [Mesorhizobium sp. BR1-1-16]|uniref:FadR/GntR family transcriptional regulator n=1 Tax=Mesorhizobium sp. BR1-1-16 TaxID=2876653 RepID=UPI001CCA67E9|nr:FCD domain-containing protein [Mesorhizobium sp. BR1-1-16]MBZ9938643.1 FCD domain-containing protein [Mesorhizobium sp. BR1-1-16]
MSTDAPKRKRAKDPADGHSSARIFAPIKAHRTFETVIERIIDAIDARGLSEGDRLPNETEMAKLLEVSRPTLRQALRILENSGVLRIRAGQAGGVFVATGMIPLDLVGKNIAHEAHHAAELIATRRMLEPIVYHLAAENASEEELDQIADTIRLMERHLGDPGMVQRADGMFHRRVAHAAGNQFLLRTMTSIYRDLNPLRGALNNDAEHGRHMIDVHSRQLAAIRARDHDAIERLLQETFVDLEEEFHVATRFSVRWTAIEGAPPSPSPTAGKGGGKRR